VNLLTISELKQSAATGRTTAALHVQIDTVSRKETRDGKPFYELNVVDAEGKFMLRAWSDGPSFSHCEGLRAGGFLEISGEFSLGNYGLESKDWRCRSLDQAERDAMLAGPPELRARQQADYDFLRQSAQALTDPRLRALALLFFNDFGERLQRTGAARVNHHARRGGLVEHMAQMLRGALAIASVYPHLNRDLIVAGVLFHDSGKLWENVYAADGFTMPFTDRAELLGHIPIGIELVNNLWRKVLLTEEAKTWTALQPESEQVRLHLLHLVAAHHGELQFGSPVVPKTPEAWALHYIDNLDAKLEMMAAGYAVAKPLAEHVFEKVWPLPGNLVGSLPVFARDLG
jgi:3'-5' exoribonuclease